MSKVRVYEVAKQLNLDPKAVVSLFQAIGLTDVRNHMSSVELDAVERVKRHLEKQKTHDVVEERIRPTVVKRRAVVKPADSVPAPASMQSPQSSPDIHEPARRPGARSTTPERPAHSGLEMRREPSAPHFPSVEEPSHPVELERTHVEREPSAADLTEEFMPSAAGVSARSSSPSLDEFGSADHAPPHHDVLSAHDEQVVDSTPPPSMSGPSSEVSSAPRPSSGPKTGVEYWTGRPGVPMPAPSMTPRIGPNPNASGTTPRRVQYDPRANTAGSGPQRRDVRSPGPQGRGPMGQRGGSGPAGRRMGMSQVRKAGGAPSTKEMSDHKKVIRIEENITLQGMAGKMSLKSTELLMKLISMGMTGIHINTTLDADTAKILASEFGWEIEDVAQSEEQSIAAARGEEAAATGKPVEVDEHVVVRAPVVTVMGHVDHGKTSLLDKIRKAKVAAGEAGGITQHIGAYKVNTSHGPIVFLDTPGHEAFTQMRARGASVTDIVILVVAADDGVMPQTKEAVAHAKSANVPILVAINKIDKPSADPERVKRELVECGLQPEEWGGSTIFVNVSAHTGEGIDPLLEMIGIQSEVLELRANPKKPASGTVLEALLDRGRGPVARVLVQDGTLRVGDFVLAGPGFGKVRAMTNEHGKQVHEAGPSTPVEILGLSDVPGAGDPLHAVKDSKKAQEIAESRKGKMARSLIPSTAKVSLEELSKRIADSSQQELRIIIKGDVQGSVEAVADALAKLSSERVRLSIIHAGVGAITEGDINLATAAKAIVVGFNVRPAGKSTTLADENKIEIRLYSIIYNAVDDVKGAMEGLLPPTLVERECGKAEVRQVFKIKNGAVAGSYVLEGQIKRSAKVRLVRDGVVLWDGKIDALKRFKDDVKDVQEGFECGITLEGFHDIKEKDIIACFEIDEIKQRL